MSCLVGRSPLRSILCTALAHSIHHSLIRCTETAFLFHPACETITLVHITYVSSALIVRQSVKSGYPLDVTNLWTPGLDALYLTWVPGRQFSMYLDPEFPYRGDANCTDSCCLLAGAQTRSSRILFSFVSGTIFAGSQSSSSCRIFLRVSAVTLRNVQNALLGTWTNEIITFLHIGILWRHHWPCQTCQPHVWTRWSDERHRNHCLCSSRER